MNNLRDGETLDNPHLTLVTCHVVGSCFVDDVPRLNGSNCPSTLLSRDLTIRQSHGWDERTKGNRHHETDLGMHGDPENNNWRLHNDNFYTNNDELCPSGSVAQDRGKVERKERRKELKEGPKM